MNIVITPYTTNVPTYHDHFVICQQYEFEEHLMTRRFSACGLHGSLPEAMVTSFPLTAIKCDKCRPFAIEYLVRQFQKKSGIKDLRILYDYLCDHHAGEDCVSIMEEFLGIEE